MRFLSKFLDDLKYEAKTHPRVTAALISILFLLIIVKYCGCSGSISSNTWSTENVAGLYLVTEGTQHIIDNIGSDELDTFTENDRIYVAVNQSGDIVSILNCPGIPDKDLKYSCDNQVYSNDQMFGVNFSNTQGNVKIGKDKTLDVTVSTWGVYPSLDYEFTNEIIIKTKFDASVTEAATDGSAG